MSGGVYRGTARHAAAGAPGTCCSCSYGQAVNQAAV